MCQHVHARHVGSGLTQTTTTGVTHTCIGGVTHTTSEVLTAREKADAPFRRELLPHAAPWAYAFDNIFVVVCEKTGRQCHHRYGVLFETVGLAALDAGKMDVVEVVTAVTSAHAIFFESRAIIHLMEQFVLGEETEGAENAGTVGFRHPTLDIGQGECLRAMLHGAEHEQADCCGADAVLLQSFFFVHFIFSLEVLWAKIRFLAETAK